MSNGGHMYSFGYRIPESSESTSSGGGPTTLNALSGVSLGSALDQQVLTYDGTNWTNKEIEYVVEGEAGSTGSVYINHTSSVFTPPVLTDTVLIGKDAGKETGGSGNNTFTDSVIIGKNAGNTSSPQTVSEMVCIGELSRPGAGGSDSNQTTVVGYNASGTYRSVSLGCNSTSSGSYAVSLGFGCNSTSNSLAVGRTARAGTEAVSIGMNSGGSTNISYITGCGFETNKTTPKQYATSVGHSAGLVDAGLSSLSAGHNASAITDYSIACGFDSLAGASGASYCTSIGANSEATGNNSLALGGGPTNGARASGLNSISLGIDSVSSANSTVSLGHSCEASGIYSIGAGFSTKVSGQYSLGAGYNTHVENNYSVGLGSTIMIKSVGCTKVGAFAGNADDDDLAQYATSVGYLAGTLGEGNYSTSLGYNSRGQGLSSFSGGRDSSCLAENGVSLGYGATVNSGATDGISIGSSSVAGVGAYTDCIAIGRSSSAGGALIGGDSIAIGREANSGGPTIGRGVSIGGSSKAGRQGVSIGYQSGSANTSSILYTTGCGYATNQTTPSDYATSIGFNAGQVNAGLSSFSGGHASDAAGDYSVACGYDATVIDGPTGNYGTCVGANSYVGGSASCAYGGFAKASGNACTMLGYASGENSSSNSMTAVGADTLFANAGTHTSAFGEFSGQTGCGDYTSLFGASAGRTNCGANSVMIGFNNSYSNGGSGSCSVGANTTCTGDNFSGVGAFSTCSADNACGIGAYQNCTHNGGINLGYNCTSSANNELKIRLGDSGTTELRTGLVVTGSAPGSATAYLSVTIGGTPYKIPLAP